MQKNGEKLSLTKAIAGFVSNKPSAAMIYEETKMVFRGKTTGTRNVNEPQGGMENCSLYRSSLYRKILKLFF